MLGVRSGRDGIGPDIGSGHGFEPGEQSRCPVEPTGPQEGCGEAIAPMLIEQPVDQLLPVGIGGTAQRQSDRPQREFEQAVTGARLQVIMPLWGRAGDQLAPSPPWTRRPR